METLIKTATASSPYLEMNSHKGQITITGRAIDYNPNEFWSTVFSWTTDYLENTNEKTTINLNFEYLNTLNTKKLFVFLKLMEFMGSKKTDIQINWFYEDDDEDMHELGKDINSLLRLEMNFIPVKELIEVSIN
ncbi:MAG: DUF1987 domain-containing protein [Flavobacteriia bacterium]|jgi:hypothetical protein